VARTPSPSGNCVTPIADKSADFRVNGLIGSQQWPVSFGLSREVVVWD
jgi:hypothetical protein